MLRGLQTRQKPRKGITQLERSLRMIQNGTI
jgi:hypothetical protein